MKWPWQRKPPSPSPDQPTRVPTSQYDEVLEALIQAVIDDHRMQEGWRSLNELD